MNPRTPRSKALSFTLGAVALGALGAAVVPALGQASTGPEILSRFPYDPACAWGRLADGRGMVQRCLTEAEARALLAAAAKATTATAGAASAGAASAATASAATASAATPAATASAAPASPSGPQKVEARILPLKVDQGELPLAAKKLSQAKDRFTDCVTKHGGLSGDRGTVQVRFLVRERGRAEGSAVSSFRGVSAAAARCVADVVDRRYVGEPEEMLVAATATVEFQVQQ